MCKSVDTFVREPRYNHCPETNFDKKYLLSKHSLSPATKIKARFHEINIARKNDFFQKINASCCN